jgi:hypothetical protein
MTREHLLLALLATASIAPCLAGCGNTELSERHQAVTVDRKDFEGADRNHARRTIALATLLSQNSYVLAKYIDDAKGTRFCSEELEKFAHTGSLRDELILKPTGVNIGWSLSAGLYRPDGYTPDAPWYYDQCFLQYYGAGPLSANDFDVIRNEWWRTRACFGEQFCDAGNRLLSIAQAVHGDPVQFTNMPYVSIRQYDHVDYFELLAFDGGYWLHVHLTDCKKEEDLSIVTVNFTAQVDDDLVQPPEDDENLLNLPVFAH